MARSPGPAAYVPIQDGGITLRIGGDIDHTFGFDAPRVDAGRESVLTFDANPSLANGEDVSLEWKLNGTAVLTQTFGTGEPRAWQEIVGKNLLKTAGNKLTVQLTDTDHDGEIAVQDVVLMYTQEALNNRVVRAPSGARMRFSGGRRDGTAGSGAGRATRPV